MSLILLVWLLSNPNLLLLSQPEPEVGSDRSRRFPLRSLSPSTPPPACCYHDNTACSLKLEQRGSKSRPLPSSPLSVSPFISQSVSSPSLVTQERRKWDRPQKKKPTKTPQQWTSVLGDMCALLLNVKRLVHVCVTPERLQMFWGQG